MKKHEVTKLEFYANKQNSVSSFLTIPNAFLIPLEAGHDSAANHSFHDSRVFRLLREKLPECSVKLTVEKNRIDVKYESGLCTILYSFFSRLYKSAKQFF